MVTINTTPKGASQLVQAIRRATSNRRGSASAKTRQFVNQVFDDIRIKTEEVARQALQRNRSGGPALSPKWQREKAQSWAGNRWYTTPSGGTAQVTKPPFAIGPQHKNVWTGTLESELTSWYNTTGLVHGPNQVGIGYLPSSANVFHPVKGIDILTLATWAHFGNANQPPRPFLNTPRVKAEMTKASKKIIARAIRNLMTTGRP